MKPLKANEVIALSKIRESITDGDSLKEINKVIRNIQPLLRDQNFPFAYAGCLLANHQREVEAMQMLALDHDNVFSKILLGYLEETGALIMASKVFEDAKPYHIYTQTPLYKSHEKALVTNIARFAGENPHPPGKLPTILDIGPGDGELTARYVDAIVREYELEKIRLIFIDPFHEQLEMASANCHDKTEAACEIITICNKVQDLTPAQVGGLMKYKPVWFVAAALSVHHMPEEQKIPMLRTMKSLSDRFILAEVNWNHDLPEKDSPELIYSVVKNYGFFCQGILDLPVSEAERKLCLYHFPLDEAINIIKSERNNRIDYHTPINNWKRIAETAGFRVNPPQTTYYRNGEPYLFMMDFCA